MWFFKKKQPVNYINGFIIPPPNHIGWNNTRYSGVYCHGESIKLYYEPLQTRYEWRLEIAKTLVAYGTKVEKMGRELYSIFESKYQMNTREKIERLRTEINKQAIEKGYI